MKKFFKEWWEVFAVALLFLGLRLFVFTPILVDGHSMDPTLEDGERMIMMKHTKLERFDIVVSVEPGEEDKNIIKRIIGMPGDKLHFDNDRLWVNGKEVKEDFLNDYQKQWKKDKLQKTYAYSSFFQSLAQNATAFTTNANNEATFDVTVPDKHYFLMGDDRLVSKDSRESSVGPIDEQYIKGEAKLSFWPLSKLKFITNHYND